MNAQEYVCGTLRGEQIRVTNQLVKTDPSTTEYGVLLNALGMLGYTLKDLGRTPDDGPAIMDMPACNEDCAVCEEATPDPEQTAAAPAPSPEIEAPTEPDPEPEAPVAEPAKTYKKEEVRAALGEARKRGVNATELLRSLGYENFTSVPAAEYGTIMAKLEES